MSLLNDLLMDLGAVNLCVLAWRAAMAARGARYRFFEHRRTITACIVFPDRVPVPGGAAMKAHSGV